jgi:hypothetical protein
LYIGYEIPKLYAKLMKRSKTEKRELWRRRWWWRRRGEGEKKLYFKVDDFSDNLINMYLAFILF